MISWPFSSNNRKLATGYIIVIGGLVILLGAIFGFSAYVNYQKASAMATWKKKPVYVNAAKARKTDWLPTIRTTGHASAIEETPVTTQVSGIVVSSLFSSGDWVKKGQMLFKLDTTQKEAELEQAKAALKLAKITYERNQRLIKRNAVSPQDLDQSLANYNEAKARVESIQADIDYHKVKAPYDGKIGLNKLNLGQFFQPGDNAATLTKIKPINIKFAVSQKDMGHVKPGNKIQFTTDAYPGKTFTATISALNSKISESNRGIEVEARYANKDDKHVIYPGMFLDVSVLLPKKRGVIVLPRNAINYTLYGETVYTLKPVTKNGKHITAKYNEMKNGKAQLVSTNKKAYKAQRIPVTTDETRDNKVVVKGVKANSWVATSGQNKLQNGTRTVINNAVDFKSDQN